MQVYKSNLQYGLPLLTSNKYVRTYKAYNITYITSHSNVCTVKVRPVRDSYYLYIYDRGDVKL